MFRRYNWLRSALLALAVLMLPVTFAGSSTAADMPGPAPIAAPVPALSQADYLNRFAELLMLRTRFSAIVESEVPDRMRVEAQRLGSGNPSAERADALRRDLTAELYYYVVNLKYLIWAEGAIWPENRPASTYRNDALSELASIAAELAAGDVLVLDIDHLLHRLERVNAWTEGLDKPIEDWFDPAQRQRYVDDALKSLKGFTRT